MNTLRLLAAGTWCHVKHLSRWSLEVTLPLLLPVVQAALAGYLLGAAAEPHRMVDAAVGAGLMGVWPACTPR